MKGRKPGYRDRTIAAAGLDPVADFGRKLIKTPGIAHLKATEIARQTEP